MKQAIYIVHWPGKDTPACEEHAHQLRSLASIMGFAVSVTPCLGCVLCENCRNEAATREKKEK